MRARAGVAAVVLLASALAACGRPVQPAGVGDTPEHHYALGMKLVDANEPARARTEFERAAALAPKYAPAYEGVGVAALAGGDLDEAQASFKKALGLDGRYVPAHLGLARTYARKGEHDAARREAEAARALDPQNARVHFVLGEVLLAALDFQPAEASFARALELEPTNADVRRAWDRAMHIRQAAPGTLVGKRIALADPVKRGELAALLATELGIETELRKRRPEVFGTRPAPPSSPPDLADHWARNAIELVIGLNLMDTYPDGTFRPDEPVTRAALATTLTQVLAVLVNDRGIATRHVGQPSPFPDVRGDHFAFTAVMVVTTRGLMEAERPTGAFRLTRPVSGPEALLAMRKLAELR